MDAGGGQNVGAPVAQVAARRVQADHREIRGAAANVHHQRRGFALYPLLVVECRGNRLELAAQVGEAGVACRALQRGLRLLVALAVVVNKVHRAPQHRVCQRLAGVGLTPPLEFLEKQHQNVVEAQALAVDGGVFVHQTAAQQALERAQQSAFGAGQVGLHCLSAVQHVLCFIGKKQRGGHLGPALTQRHHLQPAIGADQRGGRVGGAEVDAQHQGLVGGAGAAHWAFHHLAQTAGPRTRVRKAEMSEISRGCRLCGIG